MLLKSLKLNNIRSYNSQEINLSTGSSLLLGDIGSGKTTILLAIEFALFGLIKGDISGSTLLRHGKSQGFVELTFEIEGKDVTIIRKLKKSRDTITQDAGQLIIDNMSQDLTPIELKSKILEMFGYPEELLNKNTSLIYRYTVYTPQEEMKKILFESKDERLDTLRKIFNIDKYKRIRENALMYSKELKNTRKILEAQISDLDDLELELKEKTLKETSLKTELEQENMSKNNIVESLKNKQLEISSFEDKINKLNVLKKDLEISELQLKNKSVNFEKNNKDLGIIEYRINEYVAKLKDLGIIDQTEEEIRNILKDSEEKLSKINSAKEIITKRLEDKNKDLKNIIIEDVATLNYKHQTLTKKLTQKETIELNIKKSKEELDKINIDINTITINKNNSSKIINQLKDLSTCPVCLQQVDLSHKVKILDKEHASISSEERKLLELQTKKKTLEQESLKSKQDAEDLHRTEIELKEIGMKLENISKSQELKLQLNKEIEELQLKKEKLDSMDVNKLVELISKNRKMLTNIEVKKHITESLKEKELQKKELEENNKKISEELTKLTSSKEIILKEISQFIDVEKDYKIKKSEFDEINSKLKVVEIKIATLTKDLDNSKEQIEKLNTQIIEKKKLQEKIIYISELNFWINEHLINLTSTIEKAVMQKIHVEFNELFQKWFNMLMIDENIDVQVDEEFTPIITQNGYETEITNLSGGEKTAVALAYRLALNKVINDLINTIRTKDLIILDEPTDGFSSQQLDRMRDVLLEMNMKQTILVSHEAKIESYVENIIRINKNEHVSTIL